jgi:parallel beta-helix repeat protein
VRPARIDVDDDIMRCLLLPLALLALAAKSAAAALLVVPDGFPTVGAALVAAASGDTVLVRAGTYPERVALVDGVVLRGESALDPPILDGGAAGPVLTAVGCGPSTKVEQLVLRNGAGGTLGGGAFLSHSDVVFAGCLLSDNVATNGGGIGADGGQFTVSGCRFEGNMAAQSGGGIAVTGVASPTVSACTLFGNSATAGGALAILNGAMPQITGCLLESNHANEGGAAWWDFLTAGTLESSTVVSNATLSAASGALHVSLLATPSISACIVARSTSGAAMSLGAGVAAVLGCNDVFANAGGDLIGGIDLGTNLFVDPQFCNASGHVWTLSDASPCLPGGGCPQRGAFGVGCTVVSVPPACVALGWGQLKALWRR